jgi:hypothetical protein
MVLERIEIMIVVEQPMPRLYAESCDQAINRLAHREAALSQRPVVLRRGYG